MSRTPVREALFRLRNEGFLGVESKLGWYVLPIDFGRLEQLYDLRVVLELASVARLCARADADAGARGAEGDLAGAAGRAPRRSARGRRATTSSSTRRWSRAAGNAEMARVHWDVTERIRIVRRLDFTRADRIEATYAEHAKILRAVIQRKADQAQLLLRTHIEQSKAEVRKITLHTLHAARQRGARARRRLTAASQRRGRLSPASPALRARPDPGDEAEALLDVEQRRLRAVVGRGRGAAVLDQHAAVAEEVRVLQRAQHALVGVDAGEEHRAHAEVAQDAVERRVPEAADAVLVDADVAGLRVQLVDDRGRPAVLLAARRAAPGSGSPRPMPTPAGLVQVHAGSAAC